MRMRSSGICSAPSPSEFCVIFRRVFLSNRQAQALRLETTMTAQEICRKCGTPFPGVGLQGFCPACIGQLAFGDLFPAVQGHSAEDDTLVDARRDESSKAMVQPSGSARFGDYEL